jgi:hypothetical protein
MTTSNNPSNDEVMVVINKYSKELKKEGIVRRWYGLDYAGADKVYDGKIHNISLGYGIDKNLKYEEARKFFYEIVDGLLKELNENEQIRAHFYHYPLTYQDLHFALSFDYQDKVYFRKDDVEHITIQFNKIFYEIANVDGATNKLIAHETHPGMGTLSYSGEDSFRTIIRKLPETEEVGGK